MMSPPASNTLPLSFGISAAPWSTKPHGEMSAVAVPVPAVAAGNDAMLVVNWNVVLLGMAVTTKTPFHVCVAELHVGQAMLEIVTWSPTIRPVGVFAVFMVIVTVVPLSAADAIALALLAGPAQIEGRPVAHEVRVGHTGIALVVAVKASVAGLYNSAVLSAVCPGGDPAGGADWADRNELPVEPPTISTWPSSAVPLPSIRVALGPLRAMVIRPPLPLPANVNDWVLSLYSSAVFNALHWKPLVEP